MIFALISYTEFKRRFDAATEELKRWPIKLDSKTGEPTEHERRKAAAVLEQFGIVDFRLEWVNHGWVMCELFVIDPKDPTPAWEQMGRQANRG